MSEVLAFADLPWNQSLSLRLVHDSSPRSTVCSSGTDPRVTECSSGLTPGAGGRVTAAWPQLCWIEAPAQEPEREHRTVVVWPGDGRSVPGLGPGGRAQSSSSNSTAPMTEKQHPDLGCRRRVRGQGSSIPWSRRAEAVTWDPAAAARPAMAGQTVTWGQGVEQQQLCPSNGRSAP